MNAPLPAAGLRAVAPPRLGRKVACLGMGCASFGSRIAPAAGLRALCEAHEAGILWYDVAPAYGAGEAESLLAPFLKARRDRVFVATKVGLAPPRRAGLMRAAYALGRPVIGALKGLRSAFRSVNATRNLHVPLTPALIEHSLDSSLRRLGVERVELFALHDPAPEDVLRDDVMRALERARESGKARLLGVAGTHEACAQAASRPSTYDVLQCAAADQDSLPQGVFRISHSVFGVGGMRARAEAAARTREGANLLAQAGYDDAATLIFDAAFSANPQGIVLASMFSAGHLARNLAAARRPLRADAPDLLRRLVGARS